MVLKSPEALWEASKALQNDGEFVLSLVKENPEIFQYVLDEIDNYKEIELTAIAAKPGLLKDIVL